MLRARAGRQLERRDGLRWAGSGIDVGYLSPGRGRRCDLDATVIDALRAGRSLAEDDAVRRLMAFLFDYEQCGARCGRSAAASARGSRSWR